MDTITAVILHNGREVMVRSRVIRAGMIVGYTTWTGRFINIANVREVR